VLLYHLLSNLYKKNLFRLIIDEIILFYSVPEEEEEVHIVFFVKGNKI
jgi:hypothetical protein